jgi:uncharacterized membrane protein YgcG
LHTAHARRGNPSYIVTNKLLRIKGAARVRSNLCSIDRRMPARTAPPSKNKLKLQPQRASIRALQLDRFQFFLQLSVLNAVQVVCCVATTGCERNHSAGGGGGPSSSGAGGGTSSSGAGGGGGGTSPSTLTADSGLGRFHVVILLAR